MERFKYVLDWYQEQPHLLDPHLESLLGVLIDQIREETNAPLLHATAQLMAHLFKAESGGEVPTTRGGGFGKGGDRFARAGL